MKVFDSLGEAARAKLRSPVVTLGVFDGVHIGHRLVLDHLVSLARERAGEAVVVTFGRHPRAVISGVGPKLLTSLPHRLRIFASLGVSATLVLSFDDELRRMPARAFAAKVFGETLQAQLVILGYNNRFGNGGEGDIQVLRQVGAEWGFESRQLEEVRLGEVPISSSVIRQAVLKGELERASLMLGRPFSVLGTVVPGDGIGRRIGIPTANLDLHHEVRPPRGVYGCEVQVGQDTCPGLVNIGVRPTVSERGPGVVGQGWEDRDRDERVEVHLLDFDGDLYGRDLEVVLLTRIRNEIRFAGVEELRARIREDERVFRAWLEGRQQSGAARSPR